MACAWFIFLCSLFSIISAKSVHNEREGRLFQFGYSYTKTSIIPYTITSLVPSSCVHVEATLPPCRNVRFFGSLPGFGSNSNDNSSEKSTPADSSKNTNNDIQTTPLSWGEYLGFAAPTVTVNVTKITTTTVMNPNVMVTFSIKGCRPLRMPMDLDRCEIVPTSASLPIIPTSTVNSVSNVENTNELSSGNGRQLQGTQANIEGSQSNVPTASLDGS